MTKQQYKTVQSAQRRAERLDENKPSKDDRQTGRERKQRPKDSDRPISDAENQSGQRSQSSRKSQSSRHNDGSNDRRGAYLYKIIEMETDDAGQVVSKMRAPVNIHTGEAYKNCYYLLV